MIYRFLCYMVMLGVFGAVEAQAGTSVDVLSQTTKSWDGTTLSYPQGQAEMSVMRIVIPPAQTLDFHCHPTPSAAYMASGEVEVSLKDGQSKLFKTGEVITEVVGRLHRGVNRSDVDPVELIVFYAGAIGTPITLHGAEPIEGCHE